jgi:hypothetical protein
MRNGTTAGLVDRRYHGALSFAARVARPGWPSGWYIGNVLGEMLDTSPEARRFYYTKLAALTPATRLAMMYAQSRMVRVLAENAILREHPGASAVELRARVAVRLYGRRSAERVFGDIPLDAR